MANKKITDLTELTKAASNDYLEIVDTSANASKKITRDNLSGWHFLTTPLTSTSWDGDSYSTTAKTLIDLSEVFGVPARIKAVLLECAINDSGSLTYSTYGGAWIVFSGQNDESLGPGINLEKEPNDAHRNAHMIVACNPDGDIYYRINASGTGTMDVVLKVWGYWL